MPVEGAFFVAFELFSAHAEEGGNRTEIGRRIDAKGDGRAVSTGDPAGDARSRDMGGVAPNRIERTDSREFPGLDKLWRHGFDGGPLDGVEAGEQGRCCEENLDMRVGEKCVDHEEAKDLGALGKLTTCARIELTTPKSGLGTWQATESRASIRVAGA